MLKLFNKKYTCSICKEKFENELNLMTHAKKIHKNRILKCHKCGKQFVSEKDRLHHVKEEKQKLIDYRRHKKL